MALLMLGLGLGVYWKAPTKASTLFFMSNFCFSLAFLTPPYFESFLWRNVVAANFVLFITLGLAFFLHLTVVFPKPKPLMAEGGFWELIIYVPAPLLAINYLGLRLFQPRADLLVNLVLHNVFALLVGACLVLALAAVVHSYFKATSPVKDQVLMPVLLGSFIGAIPPAVGFVLGILTPQVILPGHDYYPLLSVLVTLSFGWAMWKTNAAPEEYEGLHHAAHAA